ncbi:MAG: rhodanese-like domain-containing protein [Bacteroidia bacterium]
MKNIILSAALIFSLSLIACGNAKTNSENSSSTSEIDQTPSVKTLEQKELAQKIADKKVIVIDVRTPGEVADGYIKGADKFLNVNNASFESEILKLDKKATYVMYCRSGARSGRAASFMVANGFEDVYNLAGGIMSYTGEKAK